jgi:hypothetical protein
LGRYATTPPVDLLHNAYAGMPAVLVAAGPSLAKNMHLLKELLGEEEGENTKHETRNTKHETRNSKLETRNTKLQIRNSKFETQPEDQGEGDRDQVPFPARQTKVMRSRAVFASLHFRITPVTFRPVLPVLR